MTAARLLVAAAALLTVASAGAAGRPTPARAAAAAAAARFRSLTVAPADDTGARRWVAWQEGAGATQGAHLALWAAGRLAMSVAWRDGYAPTLKTVPQWRFHGQPVAAVQVQFGAAATEVALYGIALTGRAVRLDGRGAAAVDWRADADGRPLLVTSDATGAGLVPTCLRWEEEAARLASVACPPQ